MTTIHLLVGLVWLVLGTVFIKRGWTGERAWAVTVGKPHPERASARTRAINIGFGIFFLLLGSIELVLDWLKTAPLH